MKDLIEALKLLWPCLKDPNTKWPTACEHDMLYICGIIMDKVDAVLVHKLAKLDFMPGSDEDYRYTSIYNEDNEYEGDVDFEHIDEDTWNNMKHEITNCFRSYRFGSC